VGVERRAGHRFFRQAVRCLSDGRSFNICEGILRARFRQSFRREKLLKPDKLYPFEIDLWSTSIVFNKGHRLRVHITSSCAPGYDPNPNTAERFRASDNAQVAHNTVYLDSKHASYVLLPVALSTF
jgi:putative CocE/NonD family hydrolase